MADKKIAEYFLKVPRVIAMPIKPFAKFEATTVILKCLLYASIVTAGFSLVSVFIVYLGVFIPLLAGSLAFLISRLLFTVDGYRHEVVRMLRLFSGYTSRSLPPEAHVILASMRMPFKTQRIFLRKFETDITEELSDKRIVIATSHRIKKLGTHRVENYLIVKPGKILFKQYVYLTEFGLLYRDFQGDPRKITTDHNLPWPD